MSTAPQIAVALDDMSPKTGEVFYGEYTNDTSPLIRVSLGDQAAAGETLQLAQSGAAVGSGVTITAADIAQGHADVPLAGLGDGWNLLTATITGANGAVVATSPSFALGVATTAPAAPTITGADDGSGGTAVGDGGHTGDSTPTIHVEEAGVPEPPANPPGHAPYGGPAILSGHIQLYEGDHLVGDATIGYSGDIAVDAAALAPGEHTLTAVAVDRAGNVSAASAPFHLYVDGSDGDTQASASSQPSDGDDQLQAASGFLQVMAGAGNDTVLGADASDTLHGGTGADSIVGGAQFNAVNGNEGSDTISGHSTVGDWLLGGQGDDSIDASRSSGHNIVNGNLGNDTVVGGNGGDHLSGGQGDDLVSGGSGADWISGDLGHNTLTGGGGADTFHAGLGTDVVTDFDAAGGDHIEVSAGVVWSASQVGPDTVIDLGGQAQMKLANVTLASLPGGWIVHA